MTTVCLNLYWILLLYYILLLTLIPCLRVQLYGPIRPNWGFRAFEIWIWDLTFFEFGILPFLKIGFGILGTWIKIGI